MREEVRRAILKAFPELTLPSEFQPPPPTTKREPIRCGAKTRRGSPCQAPSMQNGRCKLHGGKSTGPRTLEGKRRIAEANRRRWEAYRHAQEDSA